MGVGNLSGLAITVGIATMLLAFTAMILDSVQDKLDANTTAYNIASEGLDVLWDIVGFVGIVAIVSIAGVIISTLLTSFSGGGARTGGAI